MHQWYVPIFQGLVEMGFFVTFVKVDFSEAFNFAATFQRATKG